MDIALLLHRQQKDMETEAYAPDQIFCGNMNGYHGRIFLIDTCTYAVHLQDIGRKERISSLEKLPGQKIRDPFRGSQVSFRNCIFFTQSSSFPQEGTLSFRHAFLLLLNFLNGNKSIEVLLELNIRKKKISQIDQNSFMLCEKYSLFCSRCQPGF